MEYAKDEIFTIEYSDSKNKKFNDKDILKLVISKLVSLLQPLNMLLIFVTLVVSNFCRKSILAKLLHP